MFPASKALCVFLFPLMLRAEPTVSEPKKHTWLVTRPPQGFSIENNDTCVEYSRDGKVVYRTIERVVTVKKNDGSGGSTSPKTWSIEFVANGKAFASVSVDQAATPVWQISCGHPIHFECLPAGNVRPTGRAFRVCVPKLDYFEYVELIDNKIVMKPMGTKEYEALKSYGIKMVEQGYIDTENEGR